jgi:primosomal protein N' (replication factor Y)
MYEHFSDPLVDKIREQLALGKQIIIFQNRRGYAPYIGCRKCGYVPKCCNCDVSLTHHKRTNSLICHYCGYTISVPPICPACGGEWRDYGVGTEKIEDEVATLFPDARVARMDLDTTRNKNSHQHIINAFARHEVDILIGTQMVTKGLHFNDVSLVAVLNADSMMQSPDFRSYERAFQMLEQVAGRAGRTGTEGEVIIQSFQPDTPLYTLLQRHDYASFYAEQLRERHTFRFPPFYRLIVLTLKHRDYTRLDTAARELSERLRQIFGTRCSDVIIPPVARVQNMYIRSIRLRIEANASFSQAKTLVMQHIRYVLSLPNCKGTIIQPYVDPM